MILPASTNPIAETPHRFCLAPMMDQSDKHCRYLWRLLTRHAMVYTEMVTSSALLHGKDSERFLHFNAEEHPVALQLGGSDPDDLARCANLGQQWGYDEINLNCGCPSDRVQTGRIGACLMAEPETVAACINAMRSAVDIPVTIKHRIGIDDQDEESDLLRFVDQVAATGCYTFIVHARKAWLQGLSPRQNREVPPLLYERVYRLKQEFPTLDIILNGGVDSVQAALAHLDFVDGVMVGRQAYAEPYFLVDVDRCIFNNTHAPPDRFQVLAQYQDYCAQQLALGVPWRLLLRPVLGLFHGQSGGKRFRRFLSTTLTTSKHQPGSPDAQAALLAEAVDFMQIRENETY